MEDGDTLVDLVLADGKSGLEVYESGLARWVKRELVRSAGTIRTAIAGYSLSLRQDSRLACRLWEPALRAAQIRTMHIDGRGDTGDPVDGIPVERRGGYLADRWYAATLVPHTWFLLGRDLLVFDPAGHRFSGGQAGDRVDIRRYRIDGLMLSQWRRMEASNTLPDYASEAVLIVQGQVDRSSQ